MNDDEKVEALSQQVSNLFAQCKWIELIGPATELIRLSPEARWFFLRGVAYSGGKKQGDDDRAIEDCSEAIRLDPRYAKAYHMRALNLWAKGDGEGALRDCTSAIENELKYAEAYATRGQIYLAKGEYARAIGDFDAALRAEPGNTRAIEGRASAVLALDRQRLHEEMEKKFQADSAKYRKEFGEDFVRREKEQAREKEYGERLKKTEDLIRKALWGLGALFPAVFAALFCAVLWSSGWELPDRFFPFGFIGLVFPTALLVSPLAWWIRTLLHDKAQYAILREDAARKQRVMEYILSTPRGSDFYNHVIAKSLDHWTRQSAADLLVDFENKRAAPPAASAPEVKWPSSGDKGE